MMILIAYLLTGIASGFLAGLLGVGGGLVIVPTLTLVFAATHFHAGHAMHFAIATSLACILFTSVSSIHAHNRRNAVDWAVFRHISPGILAGTFFGSLLGTRLPPLFLKDFFALFACFAAIRLFFDMKPGTVRKLPGIVGMTASGMLIGVISSLVGIGGGSLSVPFLNWCNMKMIDAIGTSTAIGFPIAVAGTLGYAIAGFSFEGLKEYSLGYVYLPALFFLAAGSVLAAPFGARLAHRLPQARLRKIFALLLLLIGARMIL